MSTVINNPTGTEDSGSNLLIGVILVIVILGGLALFFIYGLPMMQNRSTATPTGNNINVTIPENSNPTPTPQTPAQ